MPFSTKMESQKKFLSSKKEICRWLEQKGKERLNGENIQKPNTSLEYAAMTWKKKQPKNNLHQNSDKILKIGETYFKVKWGEKANFGGEIKGAISIHFTIELLWAKPRHEKVVIVCNAGKGEQLKSLLTRTELNSSFLLTTMLSWGPLARFGPSAGSALIPADESSRRAQWSRVHQTGCWPQG